MVKKAFMKTVEVMLVVVLTSIFLLFIVPDVRQIQTPQKVSVLKHLEADEDFRDFAQNTGCTSSTEHIELTDYEYIFCSGTLPPSLPLRNVQVDSLYFAGNHSNVEFRTLRLFYWPRS